MQCVVLDWSSGNKKTLGEKIQWNPNKISANDNFLILVNVTQLFGMLTLGEAYWRVCRNLHNIYNSSVNLQFDYFKIKSLKIILHSN